MDCVSRCSESGDTALQLGKEGTVIHCFIDRGGWLGFGHLTPSPTGSEGSAGVSLRWV